MNNNIYGENQILFISKGLKLILIDDHSDTLYPFIDFSIKKLKLSYILVLFYIFITNQKILFKRVDIYHIFE